MVMKTRICHLPPSLIGAKILSKVPITSLGEVRSTCKLWDSLTREWIVGKEAAKAMQHQFLGFAIVDFKVCSLRFRKEKEEEDAVDLSMKQVGLLNQYEVRKVFHCDGLLVLVLKDESKFLAWNPYLGQTRSISPRRAGDDFHDRDTYLFGYDMNRNHKMLRFHGTVYELYEFCSNSWRVLDVTLLPHSWEVKYLGHVSLKGNAYFLALEITTVQNDVILCFDFSTETFGLQPLLLPFLAASCDEAVTLSSVRDQKLTLLHQKGPEIIEALEIWITTKIDQPFNAASVTWSKFMNVDMTPLIGDRFVRFSEYYANFFIIGDEDDEEEEKFAVVFDMDGYEFCFDSVSTNHYRTAFIIGDQGYYKTVCLGRAPNQWKPPRDHREGGYVPLWFFPPLVSSSSYLPSLVQLNNPRG